MDEEQHDRVPSGAAPNIGTNTGANIDIGFCREIRT